MFRDWKVIVLVVVLGLAATAGAQQQVPPPLDPKMFQPKEGEPEVPKIDELTPEERETLRRIAGKSEVTWNQFLTEWSTPKPYPRSSVIFVDENYAYPHVAVSIKMLVVPEKSDDETVWLVGIPPENPESPLHAMWQDRQAAEIFYKMQRQWEEEHGEDQYFLEFGAPVVPPPFADIVELEPSFAGLPSGGLWQMNLAMGDMNGDGRQDLVFPPMRKGVPRPAILLAQEGGGFKLWKDATWKGKVPLDYGGIAVADFDGDGHQDVVLGIHFKGQYVFYGDSAGTFARTQLLPSPDPRVTSRAPAVADFDLDGRLDVAFIAEIDYDLTSNVRYQGVTTAWVVYNREEGWKAPVELITAGVIGDNLAADDIDGDGRPDLIVSSNSVNYRRVVVRNMPDGSWEPMPYLGILSNALHSDLGVARDRGASPAVFGAFVQFLLVGDENLALTGLVRYPVDADGELQKGEVLVSDDQRFNPYFRLGMGDLNGDGLVDVAAGRKGGTLELYLQTADGQFYKDVSPELETVFGTPFDIQIVDLNGDGFDDLIAMFAEKEERPGGVRIWLSRPKA